MAEVLNVQLRESRGKRRARRQRVAGLLPGVLYGHGEETLSLSIPADSLVAVVRHGARLVKLAGAVDEQAFIRDVQWDTWGTHILHIDFSRVSEHELVQVDVQIELRGEAPGVKAGGIVKHLIHQIEIECEATSIPDKLTVNVNHLELNQSVTIGQLQLPPGVKALEDPESVVVECVEPVEELEGEGGEGVAEPEVIGRKKEEGEDEEKK
jgi:large subunit ribosomal protein L25